MSAIYSVDEFGNRWIYVIEGEERDELKGNKVVVSFYITQRLKLLKLRETKTGKAEKLADAVKIAQLFLAYIKSENLV